MGTRVQQLPEGVQATSAWPYTEMPKGSRSAVKGGWVLAISIDPDLNGLIMYYPHHEGPQELHILSGSTWGKRIKTRPFYRVATSKEAKQFCVTFCSMGYTRSPRLLPHQQGINWGFNWCSLTVATVKVASQIAKHFFSGRYNEAWRVGHAFGDVLEAAERTAHEQQAPA